MCNTYFALSLLSNILKNLSIIDYTTISFIFKQNAADKRYIPLYIAHKL